jgi:hypothetical protein
MTMPLLLVVSFGLVATGFIGMATALVVLWRASNDLHARKKALYAEWSLLLFGMTTGAGLSGVSFIICPIISDYTKSIKVVLALIGAAGLGVIITNFQAYHVRQKFRRRSLSGMAREFLAYLLIALATTALLLPVIAELFAGKPDFES